MSIAPVRYVHVVEFSAIHQLKDAAAGSKEGKMHGHSYVAEFGFEDSGPEALGLPNSEDTTDAVGMIEQFIATHVEGSELSRMDIVTTPIGVAHYILQYLFSVAPDATANLTDLTLTVDGRHRYTYRPTAEAD